MLIAANARVLARNVLGMTMMLVSGQILTSLQIIAAFESTSIKWGQPFTDVIEMLKLLSFDVDLRRVQCATGRICMENEHVNSVCCSLMRFPCPGELIPPRAFEHAGG